MLEVILARDDDEFLIDQAGMCFPLLFFFFFLDNSFCLGCGVDTRLSCLRLKFCFSRDAILIVNATTQLELREQCFETRESRC